MMTPSKDSNWGSIAEQVSVETDSAKLVILVGRLCSALNDRQTAAVPLTSKSQS
jgi:hypothetical protein